MSRSIKARTVAGISISTAFAVALLAGCSSTTSTTSEESPSAAASTSAASEEAAEEQGGTIALLLASNVVPRWDRFDAPMFEEAVLAQCPSCEVIYSNAQGDAATQQSQAEQAIANGADVIVMSAVDGKAAATITALAAEKGVPVIGYSSPPDGPIAIAYIDSLFEIGKAQGQALLTALEAGGDPKRGDVVIVNGDQATVGVAEIVKGWQSVLDGKVNIGAEYYTPGWDPAAAQSQMDQAIAQLGADNIIGVYSMNDGMAVGIAAALEGAGVSPLPPITGLDGDVAALQRIVAGEQGSTVFRSYRDLATAAAEDAVQLLRGGSVRATTETITTGAGDTVPVAYPATPIIVTRDNIKEIVIDGGYFTVEDICTPEFEKACKDAGLL